MHEWLSGGVSPCQGEGRGFESRLVLYKIFSKYKGFRELSEVFFVVKWILLKFFAKVNGFFPDTGYVQKGYFKKLQKESCRQECLRDSLFCSCQFMILFYF